MWGATAPPPAGGTPPTNRRALACSLARTLQLQRWRWWAFAATWLLAAALGGGTINCCVGSAVECLQLVTAASGMSAAALWGSYEVARGAAGGALGNPFAPRMLATAALSAICELAVAAGGGEIGVVVRLNGSYYRVHEGRRSWLLAIDAGAGGGVGHMHCAGWWVGDVEAGVVVRGGDVVHGLLEGVHLGMKGAAKKARLSSSPPAAGAPTTPITVPPRAQLAPAPATAAAAAHPAASTPVPQARGLSAAAAAAVATVEQLALPDVMDALAEFEAALAAPTDMPTDATAALAASPSSASSAAASSSAGAPPESAPAPLLRTRLQQFIAESDAQSGPYSGGGDARLQSDLNRAQGDAATLLTGADNPTAPHHMSNIYTIFLRIAGFAPCGGFTLLATQLDTLNKLIGLALDDNTILPDSVLYVQLAAYRSRGAVTNDTTSSTSSACSPGLGGPSWQPQPPASPHRLLSASQSGCRHWSLRRSRRCS